jgi:branched-chain amino acid transport system substrate-binding protein
MRGRLFTVPAAFAVALAVAACGSSGGSSGSGSDGTGSGGSSAPYRVTVTGGLSAQGVLAANSETSVLAAKAGAQEINARGGIDGHKVVLTVLDDGGNPSTAVTDLENEIHSGAKPDLYLNSGPSTVSAAVLPILAANHILSINNGQTSDSDDPAKFPLNFDVPGPADQVQGFVTTMKASSYKRVAIIHGSDAYGIAFSNELKSVFTQAGFTVTVNEQYDESALSMTPQLQAVEATKPDVVVMDAYGPPVGYLLKSMQLLGWNIPILGDTSVAATSLVSTAPPAGYVGTSLVKNLKMEVYKSTAFTPSDTAVNTAVKTMTSLGKIQANLILAFNYDAFPLVAAAAKAAHSIDASAIAQELVNPSVLAQAQTAMLSGYHYTAASHYPHAAGTEFEFISPSLVVNGQFGRS